MSDFGNGDNTLFPNDEFDEITEKFRGMSAEQRAQCLIGLYFNCADTSEQLRADFNRWLLSPHNQEIKDKILWKYFDEMCECEEQGSDRFVSSNQVSDIMN